MILLVADEIKSNIVLHSNETDNNRKLVGKRSLGWVFEPSRQQALLLVLSRTLHWININ